MSYLDYQDSKKLSLLAHQGQGNAYKALLMAVIREAGSEELRRLEQAFPETVEEFRQRFHAPAGLLADEIIRPGTQVRTHNGGLVQYGIVCSIETLTQSAGVRFWTTDPSNTPPEKLRLGPVEYEPLWSLEVFNHPCVPEELVEEMLCGQLNN